MNIDEFGWKTFAPLSRITFVSLPPTFASALYTGPTFDMMDLDGLLRATVCMSKLVAYKALLLLVFVLLIGRRFVSWNSAFHRSLIDLDHFVLLT